MQVASFLAAGTHSVLMARSMREALPKAPEEVRALAGDLIATTLGAAGKHFSENSHPPAGGEAYADAMADMFCAYLAILEHV